MLVRYKLAETIAYLSLELGIDLNSPTWLDDLKVKLRNKPSFLNGKFRISSTKEICPSCLLTLVQANWFLENIGLSDLKFTIQFDNSVSITQLDPNNFDPLEIAQIVDNIPASLIGYFFKFNLFPPNLQTIISNRILNEIRTFSFILE